MTTSLLLSLLVLSLVPVVTVDGDASCPTATDVSARVSELLPSARTNAAPDRARVEARGNAVRVSLFHPDGALIGTRELARSSSCPELAAAAAVVLATWESDVHPEFRTSLPSLPPNEVVAPPAVETLHGAPVLPATTTGFDLGAAISGSIAPGGGSAGAAVGGMVVATVTAPGGLGARLAVDGTADRGLPLGTGRVNWRRLALALGPQARLTAASVPLTLDIHAEALVALLSAAGDGFRSDRAARSLDPGVGLGARLLLGKRGVVPWLDLSVTGWLREQQVFVAPEQAAAILPRLQAMLALGASFSVGG